jgi:hypothetical protein
VPHDPAGNWWRRVRDHWQDREGRHDVWWIADESPGGLGDPEIWIDESAMDMYGRGDADPAVVVTGGVKGRTVTGIWWVGAVIRYNRHPGLDAPVVYEIVSRRWSRDNGGRPYYVARWPD